VRREDTEDGEGINLKCEPCQKKPQKMLRFHRTLVQKIRVCRDHVLRW
jgi:hypothetical protein